MLLDLPRYIRVNTIVNTAPAVLAEFTSSGYQRVELTNNCSSESQKWISADTDIPHVLVLPPRTDLHDHKLFLDGSIILQDKVCATHVLLFVHCMEIQKLKVTAHRLRVGSHVDRLHSGIKLVNNNLGSQFTGSSEENSQLSQILQ